MSGGLEQAPLAIDVHALRHRGFSDDSPRGRRVLAEIKRRGGRRSDGSLRQRKKATVTLQQVNREPEKVLACDKRCAKGLKNRLLGQQRAPVLPPTPRP